MEGGEKFPADSEFPELASDANVIFQHTNARSGSILAVFLSESGPESGFPVEFVTC